MPAERLTIAQLEEAIRDNGEDSIEILPNGEIRVVGGSAGEDLGGRKPLTFRENMGGEYAC